MHRRRGAEEAGGGKGRKEALPNSKPRTYTQGRFPRADRNPIITISTCVYALAELTISKRKDGLHVSGGRDLMRRHVLQLGTLHGTDENGERRIRDQTPVEIFKNVDGADVPEAVVVACETERDLLLRFARICRESGAHVYITYNGNGFDIPYVMARAKVCGVWDELQRAMTLGCPRSEVRQMINQRFDQCHDGVTSLNGGRALAPDELMYTERVVTTRAFGTQIRKNVYMPGRVNFDLLMWWRNQQKESDYSLGAISSLYLGRCVGVCSPRRGALPLPPPGRPEGLGLPMACPSAGRRRTCRTISSRTGLARKRADWRFSNTV